MLFTSLFKPSGYILPLFVEIMGKEKVSRNRQERESDGASGDSMIARQE